MVRAGRGGEGERGRGGEGARGRGGEGGRGRGGEREQLTSGHLFHLVASPALRPETQR